MNLIIDLGNTQTKLAVFNKNTLVYKAVAKTENLEEVISSIFEEHPAIEHSIVAAVGNFPDSLKQILTSKTVFRHLSHSTKVPFTNFYESPNTLGVDRIALVSAACLHFPGVPVLVIDAGSCVTYDFKDRNENYLGGAISPGLRMRYKAVHQFTAKLPELEPNGPEEFIGSTTNASIHSGIVLGMVHEIDGFIEDYKGKFPGLTTIFTGGDTHFLRDRLKNDIFANPNFLLEGLNYILEYNKD